MLRSRHKGDQEQRRVAGWHPDRVLDHWTSGGGSPIVLVHGEPADHNRWRPLLPYLEPHVTVHALDWRGRGASGDAREYRLEREYEDVAAVTETRWCNGAQAPGAAASVSNPSVM